MRLLLILLISLYYVIRSESESIENANPKVIIIGAGVAGIASATNLLDYGFKDVTILEAESRLGGRIQTIPFGDNVIDLGAQYCYGETDNVVYEYGSLMNLLQHSADGFGNYTFVRSRGELLSVDVSGGLMNIVTNILEQNMNGIAEFNGSMGAFFNQKFNEALALPVNAKIDKTIAKEFYRDFEKEVCTYEGADSLEMVSLRNFANYKDCEGDQLLNWMDKGYGELLKILMRTNMTGTKFGILDGHIKLSKRVEHIDWKRENMKALITCHDGEKFEADHVIVTVPLGVLKSEYTKLFEPELPRDKQKTIEALGFGVVNKIFLEFEKPFWSDIWQGVYFLWHDEDLNELRGTDRSWLEDIYGFHTLAYQPNVLEGWVIGDGARQMETMSMETIKSDCFYLLKRFLIVDVTMPKDIMISKWHSNPNFNGAFSYPSFDAEETNLGFEDLSKAVSITDNSNKLDRIEKPILLFAGEATSKEHFSTTHGALETGIREARRLKSYYEG